MGIVSLFVDMLRRPRSAMERLAADPRRRWIVPIAALALVSAVVVALYAPRVTAHAMAQASIDMASRTEGDPEMAASIASAQRVGGIMGVVFGIIGALVGVPLGAAIGAAVLHFFGTVMGGQQSYTQVLTATSWARVPLILGGIVKIPWLVAGGFDPNLAGLAGLAPEPEGDATSSYLTPLLSQVELWNLWYLVLLVVAVGAACRLSRTKAIISVAAFVGLKLAFGALGVFAGNFMSGMF